jgi:rhodanese-related sulfurtransferase
MFSRIKIIFIAIFLVTIFSWASSEETMNLMDEYMDVKPSAAMQLINDNPELIIIDVSKAWEYGHLPGAMNYPLGDGSFAAALPDWDKSAKYLIYCHSDAASIPAAEKMIEAGFQQVYRLAGNYGAWLEAGYDIEVETFREISAKELRQMMMKDPELIVIDVSPIYEKGHIPGAINYYLGDGSLDAAIPNLDPKAKYVVYCHGDAPAIAGAKKLIEAGFVHVYRLAGNYSAWIEAGYDVEVGL